MKIFTILSLIVTVFLFSLNAGYGQENLKISKSTSHLKANPGDEITYVIKYSNAGLTPASNVVITDQLPAADLYTYVSSNPAGVISGNVITWNFAQIPDLDLLGAGERLITVKVKVGLAGNGITSASRGFYIPATPSILYNFATIKSIGTPVPVVSNTVSTTVTQYCKVQVNNASSIIKSATNVCVYNMMIVTNAGNVYDKFTFSSLNYACSGHDFDALTAEYNDLSGNLITNTGWIAPGQTYTFLFKLTCPPGTNPGHWSCFDVIATSSMSSTTGIGKVQTEIKGAPQDPLVGLSKIDSKNPVKAGDFLTYTIYAFNSNDKAAAKNFVVHETYDSNVTFISANPVPDPGFDNKWSLGTLSYGLAAAKTISVTVQVKTNAVCEGSITNYVYGTYDGASSLPCASVVTALKSSPDLRITKSAVVSSTPAAKGETITYRLDYKNIGTCEATDSKIRDIYDDFHVDITDGGGGDFTSVASEISWDLNTLSAGQSGSVSYTVLIDPTVTYKAGTTDIPNIAYISTWDNESDYNNNSTSANIPVSILPDLQIVTSVSPALAVGTESTYTVTVTNRGDIPATNVVIKDILPLGLSIGTISNAGTNFWGTITWPTIPVFSMDDTMVYTVKVVPICLAIPSVTNTAVVTSGTNDKDESNNTTTLVSTVVDNTPPVITSCPVSRNVVGCNTAAITSPVYSSSLSTSSIAEFSNSVNLGKAGDAYCGIFSVTYQDATAGICSIVVTRTWTIMDEAGNSATCNQEIIVEPAALIMPANETSTVRCISLVEAPALPVVTDNCGNVIAPTGPVIGGTYVDCEGTRSYTYSYKDCADMSHYWVYTYTIERESFEPIPATSSTASCYADISLPALPVIRDNCDTPLIPSGPVESTVPGCEGQVTYTWTYTDCGANLRQYVHTVTIEHADFTLPANTTAQAACLAQVTVPAAPLVTDACGNPLTPVPGPTPVAPACEGQMVYSWTYTDCASNEHVWSHTVTIKDSVAPILSAAPADVAVECSSVPLKAILTATDNCDEAPVVSFLEERNNRSCTNNYTLTRTWTAADVCGNKSTKIQVITVYDNTPPVITGSIADTSIDGCIVGDIPSAVTHVAGLEALGLTISDAGTSNASLLVSSKDVLTGTFPTFVTRTYSVTDACNNSASYIQSITMVDRQKPTITCAAPLASYPADNGVCTFKVPGTSLDPIIADNCFVKLVTNDFNQASSLKGAIFPLGTTKVTWTVKDGSGNRTTCSYDVVVIDTQQPTIVCSAPRESYLDVILTTDFDPVVADNCGIASVTNDFNNSSSLLNAQFTIGTTIVNWTVTDASGNKATCSNTIVVLDNKPPTITCAAIASESFSVPVGACTYRIIGSSLDPTFEDDHTGAIVVNNYNNSPSLQNAEFPVGETTVVWTVTDTNDNTATCSQTIIVTDTQNPTISCAENLQVIAVNCIASQVVLTIPTTADNCTVVSVTNDAPSAFPLGSTIVTWTVSDASGNTATCLQTVTVNGFPIAIDDIVTVNEDAQSVGNVMTNDQGLCNSPVLVKTFTQPVFGDLTMATNGNYTYTPDPDYFGIDSFTYQICDSNGDCSTATVRITVISVNDLPIATNDAEDLPVDVVLNGNVADNDIWSGDGGNFWTTVDLPSHGTVSFNSDGTYIYSPHASFIGTDKFTYKICDGDGDCSQGKVTITIEDVLMANQILTPNGDDTNDTFEIVGIELYPHNKVTVFNRWGNVVYTKHGYQNEWDGISNVSKIGSKALPVGTYYYIIDYANNRHKTGFVYLDR